MKFIEKVKYYKEEFIERIKQFIHFIKVKFGLADDHSLLSGSDTGSSDNFVKTDVTATDKNATNAAKEELANKVKAKKKKIKLVFTIIAGIIVVILAIILIKKFVTKQNAISENMNNVQSVRIMNISSEISGSGTLNAKDSYTITSLIEGNVTGVFFDAGEQVVKDQLLITIDSSTAYRNIINASSSVIQAQDSYNQAKYEYEKLCTDYDGRTYKAPFDGTLTGLKVKSGDTLKSGNEIATLINDNIMIVKLPFASNSAKNIRYGDVAHLEIQETGEFIQGYVSGIGSADQALEGGALVRFITIKVTNPGGLTTDNTAKAYIGNFVSINDASFENEKEETLKFSDASEIDIEQVLVSEGAKVYKGTPLFLITEKTFNNVMNNKKSTYLRAEEAVTKAENSYRDAIDNYDEYFITAPINGTIISKDVKVGDKIQRNTSSAKTLCSIYDLSELTFKMDVDELDISKVKVGQTVNIQADAFNNKMFKGVITEVSLVGSNSNGVTNYPVNISITDKGELIPGMNVDGYIILASVEGALAIPSGALQRGNVVYLTKDSPTIKQGNYNIEGINDRVLNTTPEGFIAVKVDTGISNEDFIEVKSGLQEGDQVYVKESTSNSFGFGGMGGMRMPGGGGMRR